MIKLPPSHYVCPSSAIFRPDPLPPHLAETWHILRGIAWVNKYKFTPPVSMPELLTVHYTATHKPLSKQALIERIAELENRGWLVVERRPGRENVYSTVVPTVQQTAHGAEGASVIPLVTRADSARVSPDGTSQVDLTTVADSTVVIVDSISSPFENSVPIITTILNKDGVARTRLILEHAGIGEPVLSELAVCVDWHTAMDWWLWIAYVKPRPRDRSTGDDIAVGIAINRLRADHHAEPNASDKRLDEWFAQLNREALQHHTPKHRWFFSLYDGCPDCGIELLPDPDTETERSNE